MRTSVEIRDDLTDSITHIRSALGKLRANSVPGTAFSFPDAHKISEGLLLSAWTHWEAFIQELLVVDLARDSRGFLLRDIRKFRVAGAPERLAEALLSHPDAPEKWIEWNYSDVFARAGRFLSAGHRYPAALPRNNDLILLKRIRNGIAHRSDKARGSFLALARAAPFRLTPAQMRGITAGRFVFSHRWGGVGAAFVLEESLSIIEQCAFVLVP
jgi:hypothetical protein